MENYILYLKRQCNEGSLMLYRSPLMSLTYFGGSSFKTNVDKRKPIHTKPDSSTSIISLPNFKEPNRGIPADYQIQTCQIR